jgi:hypothetical protein
MLSPQDAIAGIVVAILATFIGYVLYIRPRAGFVGGFAISYIAYALGTILVPWEGFEILGARVIPGLLLVWLPWYLWHRQAYTEEGRDNGFPGVQVWLENNQIEVEPLRPKVRTNQKLTWYIDAEKDDKITFSFESKDGRPEPFENDDRDDGTYVRTGPGTIRTGKAKKFPTGIDEEFWKYQVVWRRGTASYTLDPGVWRKDD